VRAGQNPRNGVPRHPASADPRHRQVAHPGRSTQSRRGEIEFVARRRAVLRTLVVARTYRPIPPRAFKRSQNVRSLRRRAAPAKLPPLKD